MIKAQRITIFLATFMLCNVETHAARITWKCTFPPDFKEPITFLYETGGPNGIMVGNAGTSDVWVHVGASATSFVEPLFTGATQTTTIAHSTGSAIHSRHTLITFEGGGFLPSQVKGECKLWN